jgi:thiosulfate reductase cytochrome b subunit
MSQETRLNPLQKPAYMGIMFLVLPVVVITGFVMANPTSSTGVLNYIGLENIDILFYAHLLAGFFVFAFLVGHVYLATTGETIWQHFEVMITGRHKHYKVKNGEKSAE